MWPFSPKRQLSPELEDLHAKLRSLSDDVHELKRDMNTMRMEWDGQYPKYQALYARLAKQAKRAEKAAEDAPGDTNGDGVGVPTGYSSAHLASRFRR